MGFIKKYIAIVIPAALLLVAVVFIVLATVVSAGVSREVQESISMGRQASQLAGQVPPREQPSVQASFVGRLREDVDRVEQLFIETTTRELIDYTLFPSPVDTSRQRFTNFASNYRDRLAQLVASMSAVDAPSQSEIETATGGRRTRTQDEQIDLIIDALCKERAAGAQVYATPGLFSWFDFWRNYNFVSQRVAVEDSWNSQVAYWVYEDIVDTINEMNAGSRSIMNSPVKRIIGVSFTRHADGESRTQARGSRSAPSIDAPVYITENSHSPLIMDSWTKRKSNEDVDVIHFSLSVIVDVDKVPEFMKTLCSAKTHTFRGWDGNASPRELKRNQITILNFKTTPVDLSASNHEYYRYGDNAVVKWTGVCEYIFSRKAYDSIMPERIKEKFKGGEQRR